MEMRERLLVRPRQAVRLADRDPADKLGFTKDGEYTAALAKGIARLDELQYLMYAEHRHALLIVLQGMDAAGKDGTIRHVMSGFNPQGCRVTPFKDPVK
jgi:polyphosphate kinase 2 (PPK2 family)